MTRNEEISFILSQVWQGKISPEKALGSIKRLIKIPINKQSIVLEDLRALAKRVITVQETKEGILCVTTYQT